MVSLPATTWPLASTASPPSGSAGEAAGFAHQEHAGGEVPRRKVALPIGVEAAGGDPGEIERRRAEAAQPGEVLLRGGDLPAGEGEIAAPVMRQPAGDDRIGEPLPRGDADAPVVEEGALAVLGHEQLVVRRIVGEGGDDRAVPLERDRHGEMRDAVQEIGGAVERIDDPAMRPVGADMGAAFLAEEAVIRPRLGELLAQDRFGAVVGGGDEIARAFHRHLQVLDLAEIALEASPGAERGLDHDIEECGAVHGGSRTCSRCPRKGAARLHPPPRSEAQRGRGTTRSAVEGACGSEASLKRRSKLVGRGPFHRASARSPLPRFAGKDETTPSLHQLRPDIHHRLQRRAQRVFALALRRRQRLPALPVAGELIAATGAVPPTALLLFAGDPKPEQVALRLRHPGVAVLVGQPPPLRERPPAGIFLLSAARLSIFLSLSLSLHLPLQGGGRRPQAGGWG